MRKWIIVVSFATLVGCATAPPPPEWVRTDGQRTKGTAALEQQFEIDRTVCLGERQKASLSGVAVVNGSLGAALAAQDRAASADAVARGCMAEKGYLLVPQDQAEAKRLEMAAIADQKRQQEAATAAPQIKQKQSPSKPAQQPAAQAARQPPAQQ